MLRTSRPAAWVLSLCLWAATAQAGPLTSPAGNEKWSAGSRHFVTWQTESFANAATLTVAVSLDDGGTWKSLAEKVPNSGRYEWLVPETAAEKCRLRVAADTTELTNSKPFAIIASLQVPDYEWIEVTKSAEFAPRDGAGALTYRGKLWFLGGWNPGAATKKFFPRICNNEVWSSPDGKSWTLEKPNTFLDATFDPTSDWEGRHTAGYVVHQDKMWIVGGDVNQGHYHFDVWNTDSGRKWNLVNKDRPVPWGPRALHYTAAFKDKIWVMGGQVVPQFAKADEVIYNDVWNTSDGVNWEKVAAREPRWSPRGMIGGSAILNDRIWILGGGTYDTPKYPQRQYLSDVWSSTDGIEWRQHVSAAPWTPRQYHDVAVYDNRLWVMEGYAKANRNDVWYSSDGENWYEVPNTPWKVRHAASVFVHDGSLWMVAGNNMEPDVWRLQRKSATAK